MYIEMSEQHSIAEARSNLRRFSEAWDEFANGIDIPALEIDPDEVFAGVREQAPGRERLGAEVDADPRRSLWVGGGQRD